MSFASNVKDEIALNEFEYSKDLLSSLFKTSGNISIKNGKMALTFKSENSKIAQMVYKKIHNLYEVKPITSIYKSMKLKKNNVYFLQIETKVSEILEDLDIIDLNNLKNIIRSEKRSKAFLAGAFLGSGSVNDPSKTNYHLEMAFADESFAKDILRVMEKMNFSAKIIKRRALYVIYLKKAQEIADFIAFTGATNCYLEFEDVRMERDYYNIDNRLANCDIANSVRTNLAANEIIKDIELIKDKVGLASLDEDLRILAELRLANPEDSLREMANKYNEIKQTSYTKSGINHLFDKIKNIAGKYKVR